MNKLNTFEKALISAGLEQIKSLFDDEIKAMENEGKLHLFNDNFIPATIKSINSKLGITNPQ